MRLYDHVIANGALPLKADAPKLRLTPELDGTHDDAIRLPLHNAVNLDVQNIAAYSALFATTEAPSMPPHMRSPWPIAWLEWTAPLTLTDGYQRFGVLLSDSAPDPTDPPEVARRQAAVIFMKQREGPAGIVGTLNMPVAGDAWTQHTMSMTFTQRLPPGPAETMAHHARRVAHLAIAFAHCKNVTTVDHETPPKVAKKRQKKGQPVGATYKTLVIDGMKEILRTQGNVEKNGIRKAFHLCRGHFATYTEDKPLFGKVTGTFWKPMHVRGNKQEGEVKKDYSIMPVKD